MESTIVAEGSSGAFAAYRRGAAAAWIYAPASKPAQATITSVIESAG